MRKMVSSHGATDDARITTKRVMGGVSAFVFLLGRATILWGSKKWVTGAIFMKRV